MENPTGVEVGTPLPFPFHFLFLPWAAAHLPSHLESMSTKICDLTSASRKLALRKNKLFAAGGTGTVTCSKTTGSHGIVL